MPGPIPVTIVLYKVGLTKVPVPDEIDQIPTPLVDSVALSCAKVAHTAISVPALAVATLLLVITTSSLSEQEALVTVHLKVLSPDPRLVKPEFLKLTLVMVALPLNNDHTPVPNVGAFAAKVAVVLQVT